MSSEHQPPQGRIEDNPFLNPLRWPQSPWDSMTHEDRVAFMEMPDTDLANARRVELLAGGRICFVKNQGWHVYDGSRWIPDEARTVDRYIALVGECIRIGQQAGMNGNGMELTGLALSFETSAKRRSIRGSMETLASLRREPKDFDRDPDLLNCQNGVVDLRTGNLMGHSPELMMRHQTGAPYNPEVDLSEWRAIIEAVSCHKQEFAEFLQRLMGYSATGHTREQKMAMHQGSGSNGKSTVVVAVETALGSYATVIGRDVLSYGSQNAKDDTMAQMHGVRMVRSSEIDAKHPLNEGWIKSITDGTPLRVRQLYSSSITLEPMFTLHADLNDWPRIEGTDDGIWRRLLTLPWNAYFADKDDDSTMRQRAATDPKMQEAVLRWVIEGAMKWHQEGLHPPAMVLEHAVQYRDEEDFVAQWLEDPDFVRLAESESCSRQEARLSYEQWRLLNGAAPLSARQLATRIAAYRARRIQSFKSGTLRWRGFSIVSNQGRL